MTIRIMLGSVLSLGAFVSFADDGVWIKTGSNTPETAYQWMTEGNWQGGIIPRDLNSVADFATTDDSRSTRFIGMPAGDLDLKSFKHSNIAGRLRLLGEGTLGVSGGVTKSGTITDFPRIYADLANRSTGDSSQFNSFELCGDFTSSKLVILGSGMFAHRLDLYAKGSGGNRISPMSDGIRFSMSYGGLSIRCPESSATNNVSRWQLVGGGRFARKVGGVDHALPIGTFVTAANGSLPSGTYLKRIYDRDVIELSAAVQSEGTVETDLTFEALTQCVLQNVGGVGHMGTAYAGVIRFSKYRAEDSARMVLGYVERPGGATDDENRVVFDCETDFPGTIVIEKAVGITQPVELKNCHLEFAPSTAAAGSGFPLASSVRHSSATSYSRLTVTNGVVASIPCLSNVVGRMVKDGEGTLSVAFPWPRKGSGALVNTGIIEVEEGELHVAANDNGNDPEIQNVQIGSDGEVHLEDGVVFKVGTLRAETGAVVSGKGTIVLPTVQDVSAITLKDGARIVAPVGGQSRERVVTAVEAMVVGNPAFWVDATAGDSLDLREEADVRYVEAWYDRREQKSDFASPKYLFATNVAGVCPTLIKNADGADYAVNFANHTAEAKEVEKTEALVWSVPVKGIKAIFKVLDPAASGGTCVLGQTYDRLNGYGDCLRRVQYGSVDGSSAILNSNARAGRACENFLNGERVSRWSSPEPGYPIQSYTYSSKSFTRCVLHEIWNTNNVDLAADAFGYSYYTKGANGGDRICECIVYTNELTYAERLQVAEYLTQKWCGGEATYDRFGGVANRISELPTGLDYCVGDGKYVAVEKVVGTGTLMKSGAGEMYVDDLSASGASVKVTEGTLTVRSVAATRSGVPAGAYLHLDASDVATITDEDGVTEWRDCRGANYPVATPHFSKPAVKTVAALGGRNVVDFGDFHQYDSTTRSAGKGLEFAALNETRSVFFVYGSERGGGNLIGGSSGDYHTTGLFRGTGGSLGADPTSPLISSDSMVPRYARLTATSGRDFGGSRFRRDGVDYRTGTDGFGGKFEVVSLVTPDAYVSSALSLNHYTNYSGGQDVGEFLVYERVLSGENVKLIEAYLRNKWFGDALPVGYRPAEVSSLEVSDGAILSVCGNAPLTVGSLSGGGTIEGEVSLAGGEFVVTVSSDGSLQTLTVGCIDLTAAATLSFVGEVKRLAAGDHVILSSQSIRAGDPVNWSITGLAGNRDCQLVTIDGALVARVFKRGLLLIVQ